MILLAVGFGCLVWAGAMFLFGRYAVGRNEITLVEREKQPEFAVLIPARDESAVIEGLLESLEKQTVKIKTEDVYVIVETKDDPTVEICRKHGAGVFVRPKVTLSRARKGFALDEVIRDILSKRRYDLYFIFDADNVLAPEFMEGMLESYMAGYEIITGYRNAKNGNANAIAAVSCLTFSMINTLVNRDRAKHQANIVFSGTGYCIDGKLVDRWQGWPFRSLTEDYEISLYATLHGLATYYNEAAVFYDEQPTRYTQTVAQRVRWIKGYFSARKKYVPLMRGVLSKQRAKNSTRNAGSLAKECIGVKPAILAVVGAVLVVLGGVVMLGRRGEWGWALAVVGGAFVLLYIILAGVTVHILRQEKLDLARSMKIKIVLFNPLYLVTYVPCALKALLRREVAWVKIEHGAEQP